MKTVGTFPEAQQAYVMCSYLQSFGIAAHVRDAATITLKHKLSLALGGVKVEVADEDFAAAKELLAQIKPDPVDPAVEQAAKPRHCRDRYVKLFVVLAPVFYTLILFSGEPQTLMMDFVLVLPAVAAAGVVAGFCALVDL